MRKTVPAIISNNCWGASYYAELGVRYTTPFVGLFLYADDYLNLLENFRPALRGPLEFTGRPAHGPVSYPVGVLKGGIEIHFMHYPTADEARAHWLERAMRLPGGDEQLLVKICDRDGLTESHLKRFEALPFRHKIAFAKRGKFSPKLYPSLVEIDCDGPDVPDGLKLWDITREALAKKLGTTHFTSLREPRIPPPLA